MNVLGFSRSFRALRPAQKHAFIAAFMGWSLDAFDFFILVFCISAIAEDFHAKVAAVSEALFWTLAMRPLGAVLFGAMADRFGRRPTLMVNILCFSVLELASAFAPSLHTLIILRALFGIAMGGEWGVGAALAFESLPREGRGFFSGILQEGYVVGYLLAAAAYAWVYPAVHLWSLSHPFLHLAGFSLPFSGWRAMFVLGALPALLVIYVRAGVEESPTWTLQRQAAARRPNRSGTLAALAGIRKHLPTFLFVVLLMAAFNSFSHGTQDIYPTFLQRNHGFSPRVVGLIAIVYNLGALCGGIFFGGISERVGRKKAIIFAALLAIPAIPLWAWSSTVPRLALGAFALQFMVQGAWGVVPAYLNELSPAAVRATFPGFAYQLGNLLASRNSVLQAKVAEHHGGNFGFALGWTAFLVAIALATITAFGRESRGADLARTD